MVYIAAEEESRLLLGLMASSSVRLDFRGILKGALVVLAGALMVLPAYLNLEIFRRLHFDLVVSLSISLVLFALGILTFIVVKGKEAFEESERKE